MSSADQKTTAFSALEIGGKYKISGGLTTPAMGLFLGYVHRRCSLHNDSMGQHAEFELFTPSGKAAYRTEVPHTARFEKMT
jgi:hypothetical protein